MTWLILLVSFGLTIFGASFSFLEKHQEFKKDNSSSTNYRVFFGIAIIGATLALISGINFNYEKHLSSIEAKNATGKLIKTQFLNTQLLLAQKDSSYKIIVAQNKIIDLNEKLENANSKIFAIQDSLFKNITGNGNIPKLSFGPINQSKFKYIYQFHVANNGKTPIRGITAIVQDMYSDIVITEIIDGQAKGYSKDFNSDNIFKGVKNTEKKISVGDLPPNTGNVFYYPEVPKTFSDFSYFIRLYWDNGFIYCYLIGSKNPNQEFPELRIESASDQFGNKINSKSIQLLNF